MRLDLPIYGLAGYKSPSQRARVATEGWGEGNLYCPNCPSPRLRQASANSPAIDYTCPRCESVFQLKAQSHPFASRIVDAAYSVMFRAIVEDRTPNLLALHYERDAWRVINLILIPRFAFSRSSLEKRKPLGPTARRAGWVGCNILLDNIPPEARIPLVVDGIPMSPKEVRKSYEILRPLANLGVEKRGWTLDVLNTIRLLGKCEFSLAEMYAFEKSLAKLHPDNRHIRDKIRQQLQILRDLEFIDFLGGGKYRLH